GSSRRYLCESFLRCLSPYPGGLLSAFAWFFLSLHRPSPSFDRVGFPLKSANTIFHGSAFEAAAISLCSGLQVCSPPRSFLPQQVSLQGSRGSLHPSRTCVVTFARIGHTIRPTTGNWRNEDFHLARFAALSAAHSSSKLLRTRHGELPVMAQLQGLAVAVRSGCNNVTCAENRRAEFLRTTGFRRWRRYLPHC